MGGTFWRGFMVCRRDGGDWKSIVGRVIEGAEGLDVVEGDATDPELWQARPLCHVPIVLLAMPFHGNNIDTLRQLRAGGFAGTVAVVAQYKDDLRQAERAGAAVGFQLYDGAGAELADRAAVAAGLDVSGPTADARRGPDRPSGP